MVLLNHLNNVSSVLGSKGSKVWSLKYWGPLPNGCHGFTPALFPSPISPPLCIVILINVTSSSSLVRPEVGESQAEPPPSTLTTRGKKRKKTLAVCD